MNAVHFDRLARSLSRVGSRRRTLAAALAAALGLLGASSGEDAAAKKKKPCAPCKKRNKQGKCKKSKPNGTACRGGTCQGGRYVAASVCPPGQETSGGVCGTRPTCKRFGVSCDRNNALECCSGGCFGAVSEPDACLCSQIDEPCVATSDCCQARRCVGFVCTP
jgi:hypothetical protein